MNTINRLHEWVWARNPAARSLWPLGGRLISFLVADVIAATVLHLSTMALVIFAAVQAVAIIPSLVFIVAGSIQPRSYRRRLDVLIKMRDNDYDVGVLNAEERAVWATLKVTGPDGF